MIAALLGLARGVLPVLGSLNGYLIAALLGLVTMIVMWDGARIDARVSKANSDRVLTERKTTNAALKARAAADRPGAVERLRQRQHCRDC